MSGNDWYDVAKKLWNKFVSSPVATKKILHFVFGEQNEHKIDPKSLNSYGFKDIYDRFSTETVSKAKIFLRVTALEQLRECNLEAYLSNRRIKNKEQFVEYFHHFLEELDYGFLRKRIPREKAELHLVR